MYCSACKFTLNVNSALLLRKLLVFEFLLGISENSVMFNICCCCTKHCPSARWASSANVDILGNKTVSPSHIL
jgi:hypothetical protein